MSMLRSAKLGALALALTLLTSGCFLRTILGGVFEVNLGDEISAIVGRVFANATGAVCGERDVGGHRQVECTYVFASEMFPFVPHQTSTAELIGEFGLFGVIIDPLILQVPSDVHGVVATFREEGDAARVLETAVTDRFLAAPGRVVAAEPGQQFVILQLPDDVADRLPEGDPRLGRQFAFDLEFRLSVLAPVEIKPMFTLAVEADGVTYYPPMLPCVTDFAQVPGFELPVTGDNQLQSLYSQVAAAITQTASLACDGEVYDFTAAEPPPGDDEEDPTGPTVVAIDVKPGSDHNPVNPASRGVIPVAVLTTSAADGDNDFDASTLDPASVRFGRGEAAEAHGQGHLEDVDADGDLDVVLHFATPAADIRCGDTEVALTGVTIDGQPIIGVDTIVTVPCE
jgi:hypothetical protein